MRFLLLPSPSPANGSNLNSGTSAERIFLCYKKEKAGNPIIDLQVILPGKGEEAPKGFNLLDLSPTGRPANLNSGTGGGSIFICYRQRLKRLACLASGGPSVLKSSSSPSSQGVASRGGGDFSKFRSTDSLSSQGGSTGDTGSIATYGRDSPTFGQPQAQQSPAGNRVRTETEDSRYDASTTSDPAMDPLEFSSLSPDLRRDRLGLELKEEGSMPSPRGLSIAETVLDMEEEVDSEPSVDELTADRDRFTQAVVDGGQLAPEVKRRALHALLSALYLKQSGVADCVTTGLTALLRDTDFYHSDLTHAHQPGTLTLLDVTIEAVCDRVEVCVDAGYDAILEFLQVLIKHSRGRLSPMSLQRVFRALSFLLNSFSTRGAWMKEGLPMPLDSDEGGRVNAYKVLRDLVWSVVTQVETVDVAASLPDDPPPPQSQKSSSLPTLELLAAYERQALGDTAAASASSSSSSSSGSSEVYVLAHSLVLEFIEELTDSVEVSRIAESTQLAISKQSSSTSSGSFWQHINVLSRRLFSEYPNRCAFVVLCATTKLAWHDVRNISSGSPMPRDLGTKVLALEALLEFLLSAGERMRVSKVMGYMVRRLVVPCILYNVQFGLKDLRVFGKIMKLITALWKVWRSHVRIEFALLVEQIVIRVMQADMVKIRPVYQMIVIQEVVTWFDQPHLLVEMFVNYDMDRKFVSHWNIFSHLIRAVCATARKVSLVTGAWDWKPRSESGDDSDLQQQKSVSVRTVQMQALEEVGRISKTLMDATGHAYLIMQDANFRYKALGAGTGWEEDITDDALPPPPPPPMLAAQPREPSFESVEGFEDAPTGHRRNSGKGSQGVKFRRAVHQEAEELLREAIKIYEQKSSLLKAVRYLIDKNFMGDTPQEIASFLRVYKNSLDPSAIGDFLGEGGKTPAEAEYWSQIRFRYTRAVSFVEMDVEPALRLYLTGCGFRLPGEAQKVDRFVEVFVKTFWQDNSGTAYCPFSHPDTLHLVSFAIIMLNTDHHRANISKTKKSRRMTKEDFLGMLRGQDGGQDIDRKYLLKIFDTVQAEAIELAVEASKSSLVPPRGTASVTASAASPEASTLSSLSLLSSLSFRPSLSSADLSFQEEHKFFRDVTRTLRDSEDLLRSLSSFTYRFQLTGVDTNISMDLVSFMYETVWFHFRSITEALLGQKHKNDMHAVFIVLDILCYSLTASIFLGLKVEAQTFAEQLLSFLRTDCDGVVFPETGWYADIGRMVPETAMETIAKVHTLMVHVKDAVQESANREVTRSVAARIEKKANVLENNSFFVREGDLAKRNRNGRFVAYRFFLFSDQLIYAHQGLSGEYKVHGMLHLTQMAVTDLATDANRCSMYLQHPIKSFVIVADSPGTKQHWLRDLQQTISNCIRRAELQTPEGRSRQKSLLNRIESQQRVMDKEKAINISSPGACGRSAFPFLLYSFF